MARRRFSLCKNNIASYTPFEIILYTVLYPRCRGPGTRSAHITISIREVLEYEAERPMRRIWKVPPAICADLLQMTSGKRQQVGQGPSLSPDRVALTNGATGTVWRVMPSRLCHWGTSGVISPGYGQGTLSFSQLAIDILKFKFVESYRKS